MTMAGGIRVGGFGLVGVVGVCDRKGVRKRLLASRTRGNWKPLGRFSGLGVSTASGVGVSATSGIASIVKGEGSDAGGAAVEFWREREATAALTLPRPAEPRLPRLAPCS